MAGQPPRLQVDQLRSALAGPFTFNLNAGECLAISGPSGAGKSLLLRMLCDLDPSSGGIALDGAARSSMSAPAWRSKVVYQPAEAGWWDATPATHFKPEQMEHVRALLPRLGLSADKLDTEVRLLSTGERQRMALLRSLACQPQVLLLDEPTAALDPASTAAVAQLLQELMKAGLALVLVTHSEAQAQLLGTRRMRLENRQLHDWSAA